MLIVTFYTNKRYITYYNTLQNSCNKFGYKLKLFYKPTKNAHSWSEAILKKVEVLTEVYQSQPILYLDCDCIIVQPLDDLFNWTNKHQLCIRVREGHANTFQAGVMGIGKGMDKFLRNWLKSTTKQFGENKTVDQEVLTQMLNGRFNDTDVRDIGPFYNFTEHDALNLDKDKAKILHLKASKTNDYARAWFKKWIAKNPSQPPISS